MEALARDAPRLRCELVEAEPEQALPALALGDVDLVLGDEWQHQPLAAARRARAPRAAARPGARSSSPPRHPARAPAPRTPCRCAELAGEAWTTGHAGMGWEEMTQRTCREHGGFEPDIRHRTNDATVSLALVARGLAVTLLPDLAAARPPPGRRAARDRRAPASSRAIFAVTRAADAARPSTQALLAAVQTAAAAVPRS